MKLGVIYEPSSANAYYRAVFPLRELERRGHTVVWPTRPDAIPMREFLGCDLVHCYRRTDRLGDLRALSARGVAISFDNDDDFAAAEVSDGGQGLAGRRHNLQIHRKMLQAAKLADVTTTPSALLAERYRAAGVERVRVIENHLCRSFGFGSRTRHDGVVVGWIAGWEHRLDLDRVPIADALRRLLHEHPQLRVLTVGVRLPLDSERYEHIDGVEYNDLLKTINRIDIGIAPVADTPFNLSRSNVKLKEYSSGGAMWLASPVGPYRGMSQAEGGHLVRDDEWFAAIDRLLRHPRSRRRLARRALRWAKSQTLDRHVDAWEHVLTEAVGECGAARAGR
jgi:glycosyltransferase involved in cell wall biosynthesis